MVSREQIEQCFGQLCAQEGRQGVIGLTNAGAVRLLPQQEQYLRQKLAPLGEPKDLTAVCLGLFYHEREIVAVPYAWQARATADDPWNEYARAYGELNRALNRSTAALMARFGGLAEQATVEGWASQVGHVHDYFPHCVSHRAFAEAAGLGWRGRHGLIVTPEAGPALRFAIWFVRGRLPATQRPHAGCGRCSACLDACPIVRQGGEYREVCRRRLNALGLEDEVCGICVRVCWEHVQTSCATSKHSLPVEVFSGCRPQTGT